MKLVQDWKRAWRYFSVHAMLVAGTIPWVWNNLIPADWQARIPLNVVMIATTVTAILGIIGRIIDQENHHDTDDHPPDAPNRPL